MSRSRPLRVEEALGALPEVDDLHPLRGALVAASREDGGRRWAASEAYATVDGRLADPDALAAQLPALADALRDRAQAAMAHALDAVRALGQGDEAAAARALVAAGEVQERAGRLDAARACYERAREIGSKPRDRAAEGLALRRLGRIARMAGELQRAKAHYLAGFEVARDQRDSQGMIVACQGLGNVFVDQGRWAEAREWYVRGVDLLATAGGAMEEVHLCTAMAVVERRLGRLDESEAWLDRGQAAAERAGDPAGPGFVLNARGMLHLARGRSEDAESAFRRALEADLDPAARAGVMVNLADPLLRTGRLPHAERVAREAERLAIQHRVLIKLPDVYRTLGAIAQARGDAEGFVFFEQALDVCRRHGLPAFETAATQHRYGLFEAAMGSLESAAARLRAARDVYSGIGAAVDEQAVAADIARVVGMMETYDAQGGAPDGPPPPEPGDS
jgi:tetratricopeptide (TPR) repeat protein